MRRERIRLQSPSLLVVELRLVMASGQEQEPSVFAVALQLLPTVRGESAGGQGDGAILLEPFCKLCRTVLPVIDRLGTGLVIVKNDISGNIVRLEKRVASTKVISKETSKARREREIVLRQVCWAVLEFKSLR